MAAPPPLSSVASYDDQAIRTQLRDTQDALRIAETALANEREANVAAGVRTAINDAIRSQWEACDERDRLQRDYQRSQTLLQESLHAFRALERELVELLLKYRVVAQENEELVTMRRPRRYSPFGDSSIHYRRSHFPVAHDWPRTPTTKSPRVTSSTANLTPLGSPYVPPVSPPREPLFSLPPYDGPTMPFQSYSASRSAGIGQTRRSGPV